MKHRYSRCSRTFSNSLIPFVLDVMPKEIRGIALCETLSHFVHHTLRSRVLNNYLRDYLM